MEKLMIHGFIKFAAAYTNGLMLKKTVALFSSYTEAKEMLLMELADHCGKYDRAEYMEALQKSASVLENETDIVEWFNNL